MKLSEFINECKEYLDKYGDLDVVMIAEYPNLDTPLICHSEYDYTESINNNIDFMTWKDIKCEKKFIIDSYERNMQNR